jgi:translation initiation factor eIF-2B subunit epsilon
LEFSDQGSVSSSEESESSEGDEDDDEDASSIDPTSSSTSLPLIPSSAEGEAEFRTEARQSLERAFAEDHSLDNAAVELKTLRMASNVPLRRVREAVVAGIVGRIRIVPGDVVAQRKEIARVVGRWGELINKIGGVDGVETVAVLQVRNAIL